MKVQTTTLLLLLLPSISLASDPLTCGDLKEAYKTAPLENGEGSGCCYKSADTPVSSPDSCVADARRLNDLYTTLMQTHLVSTSILPARSLPSPPEFYYFATDLLNKNHYYYLERWNDFSHFNSFYNSPYYNIILKQSFASVNGNDDTISFWLGPSGTTKEGGVPLSVGETVALRKVNLDDSVSDNEFRTLAKEYAQERLDEGGYPFVTVLYNFEEYREYYVLYRFETKAKEDEHINSGDFLSTLEGEGKVTTSYLVQYTQYDESTTFPYPTFVGYFVVGLPS